MEITKKQLRLIEFLVVALVVNYMFVTIVLNDFILFKYLRDILLVILIVTTASKSNMKFRSRSINPGIAIGLSLFLIGLLIGCLKAPSISVAFTLSRSYKFPLLFLFIMSQLKFEYKYGRFLKFIMLFFAALSIWGIFQAQILGDAFLRKLGYPLVYSYYYKRDMLYNSFYFGGFGIQRVVATLSSSNICALLMGSSLFCLIICKRYISGVRHPLFWTIVIGIGYVLTFSRSNFLAMLFVVLLIAWPYIPYKRQIALSVPWLILAVLIVAIFQGENSFIYKLLGWIQDSFNFTESSAAGRLGIWLSALAQVFKSPFGIGLGHVGGLASQAGVTGLYFSSENSYLAIALDTGWIGITGYLIFMISLILQLKKKAKFYKKKSDIRHSRVCIVGYVTIVYMMIVMFFSNHIHDMEVVSMVYIYAGIALSLRETEEDTITFNTLSECAMR